MNRLLLLSGVWVLCASFLSLESSARARAESPFLWGVANAAFQVEGTPGDSDWARWTHTEGRIKDRTNADHATDFWNRYDEDFELAQRIGLNSFRLSVAWERIEPSPGVFAEEPLRHYRQIIHAMRARGLEPIVTLQHFVLPGWLADQGGLLAPSYVESFARFAEHVTKALSEGPDGVRWWITLNEPEVMILGGYLSTVFPPGKEDLGLAMKAMAQLAQAHLAAVGRMRALGIPGLRVSIAKNWVAIEPKDPQSPMDRYLAGIGQDFYNHQFINAVMTGKIRFGIPPALTTFAEVALPGGRPGLDFLGLNYYTRNLISPSKAPPFFSRDPGPGPRSDLDWEIYPDGLRQALRTAYSDWALPILITENGIADAVDSRRSDYLEAHLNELARAREEGIPILGYLHWSLTDNFEWAEGQSARFGLVEIDYRTQERKPRASYLRYGELVRKGIGLLPGQ